MTKIKKLATGDEFIDKMMSLGANNELACSEKERVAYLDSAIDLYEVEAKRLIEKGRLSVLQDFDAMCHADAFMGFKKKEWKAIQKFFAFNKALSGWDKHQVSCIGCIECSSGDENLQEFVDPLK